VPGLQLAISDRELKAGQAGDDALGQVLGYLSWVRENIPNASDARAIIVCQQLAIGLKREQERSTLAAAKRGSRNRIHTVRRNYLHFQERQCDS